VAFAMGKKRTGKDVAGKRTKQPKTQVNASEIPAEQLGDAAKVSGVMVLRDDGTLLLEYSEAIDSYQASSGKSQKAHPNFRMFPKLMDFAATIFWAYALLQLFVLDVPTTLVSFLAPNALWMLDYKIVVSFALVIAPFLLLKRSEAISFLVYIALFPFVLAFWKAPKYLIKSRDWRIVFAVLSASIRFYRSLKLQLALFLIWVVAVATGIAANSSTLLIGSIVALCGVLFVSYALRFLSVFTNDPLDEGLRFFIDEGAKNLMNSPNIEEIRGVPVANMTEQQIAKRLSSLENSFIWNRTMLFFANQFRIYRRSGVAAVGVVFTALRIFVSSVTTFAVVAFAIQKIDPTSFSISNGANFFDFVYYSFNAFLLNSVNSVEPISTYARVLAMAQVFFGFLLVAILIALLFSVHSARTSAELDKIIEALEGKADELRDFMFAEFRLSSLNEVVEELNKMKHSVLKLYLSIMNWNSR
jgi:hypothetical protein